MKSIAPNPNHGFAIVLHRSSVVWVDASYEVEDSQRTLNLNARLGTLKDERKSWKTIEVGRVELHEAIVARGFDRGTPIIYTIEMDTAPDYRDAAYRVFEAVVASFRRITIRP